LKDITKNLKYNIHTIYNYTVNYTFLQTLFYILRLNLKVWGPHFVALGATYLRCLILSPKMLNSENY